MTMHIIKEQLKDYLEKMECCVIFYHQNHITFPVNCEVYIIN